MLDESIERVLVSKDELEKINKRLGEQLTKDYKGRVPIVVGLLKGCIPFMPDLLKYMDLHVEIGYMDVSSYFGGISSTSDVKIEKDLNVSVNDRDILIAEDIVDSGRTLNAVIDLMNYRGARSVKVVTLLNKPAGRVVDYTPDYIGVDIPNLFVVGYGLDYKEFFRNLPYVGILKPEVYNED
ncbi:MAG: hypoxanthine phosphoribosyltransferase [Bacillota bacterium]